MSFLRVDSFAATGLYLKDPGASVHYYRKGSAAAAMGPNDAKRVPLETAKVFHFTGITPALSLTCRELVDTLVQRARATRTFISLDVNFRPALWPAEEAQTHLLSLGRQVDGIFVGLDEAQALWGCDSPRDVRALFPHASWVVVKNDAHGATEFISGSETFVPALHVSVVEPIGAGDAFAAGYLSGALKGENSRERLQRAHQRAASVLQSTSDLPLNSDSRRER